MGLTTENTDSPVQNNQRVLTGTECMHLELAAPYCSSSSKLAQQKDKTLHRVHRAKQQIIKVFRVPLLSDTHFQQRLRAGRLEKKIHS